MEGRQNLLELRMQFAQNLEVLRRLVDQDVYSNKRTVHEVD